MPGRSSMVATALGACLLTVALGTAACGVEAARVADEPSSSATTIPPPVASTVVARSRPSTGRHHRGAPSVTIRVEGSRRRTPPPSHPARPSHPVAPSHPGPRAHRPPPAGPWQPQVVDPGDFDALVGLPGGLYATVGGGAGALLRIDPATGRILARSAPMADPGDPVEAGRSLWVTGLADSAGTGSAYLFRLDPSTLRVTARVALAGPLDQYGLAAAGGALWAVSGCSLLAIDLRQPARVAHRRVALAAGCAPGSATLVAAGPSLLASVAVDHGRQVVLQERAAGSGRLGQATVVPGAGADGVGLTADARAVWATSGVDGAPGSLDGWTLPALHLLGSSGGHGSPAHRLPSFGSDPQADISGGVLWVAGPGALGCLDPATGQLRSGATGFGPGPTIGGPVVVTPAGDWSIALDLGDGAAYGLARIHPPAACAG